MQRLESHFTATGFVLNKKHDRALVIFHNKLQVWLPAGGHIDAGELPHEAVVREVFEETGVTGVVVDASKNLNLDQTTEEQLPAPIFVLHELIPAHKGKPEHKHYDFLYFLIAQDEDLKPALGEVAHAKWVTQDELELLKTTQATLKIYRDLLLKK